MQMATSNFGWMSATPFLRMTQPSQTIMDDDDAPSANEAARPWPSALLHANDRVRDAEFADVLNRTEIVVASFQKEGGLTLRLSCFWTL